MRTGKWHENEWWNARCMADAGKTCEQIGLAINRTADAVYMKFHYERFKAPPLSERRQGQRQKREHNRNSAGQATSRIEEYLVLDRERRASAPRSLTALFFGDPPQGYRALDKRS